MERGWNVLIYTSSTVSLAALEVLVHHGLTPADYRVIKMAILESIEIYNVDIASLGPAWYEEGSIPRIAAIGTLWVTLTVEEVRVRLPFPMLGLDVDTIARSSMKRS